jgi:hypothetical protein
VKLGDALTDETVSIINPFAFRTGILRGHHTRCGAYVYERREVGEGAFPQRDFRWVCVSVERPDAP